jgi:GTP cyclohydrolase III
LSPPEHREYTELKFQGEEVDKKVEVYRPIVNLVHNMVNMGSLYGGDNYMLASQYRKVGIYTCMVNMGSLYGGDNFMLKPNHMTIIINF